MTGSTGLNGAGDRRSGSYDLWAIRADGDGHFAWESVTTYEID